MIVAIILALVPVAGFVLLLIFSDLGGNEPSVPTSMDAGLLLIRNSRNGNTER